MATRRFHDSTGGDDLVACYEELRNRAMGGENISGPERGFVLFLRRGMAAWMNAWSECVMEHPERICETFGDGVALPVGARSEAAMILTGMALSAVGRQRSDVISADAGAGRRFTADCQGVTI